jgi:hypothetical protein
MNWLRSARNRVSKLFPLAQGNLSFPTPSSPRKRRFAPRVEELEARLTPAQTALTVSQNGPFLTIHATTAAQRKANHHIAIYDDGAEGITVYDDVFAGGRILSFTGVSGIWVSGGDNHDDIGYVLTGNLQIVNYLGVTLKPANDTFTASLFGNIGNAALNNRIADIGGRTSTNGWMQIFVGETASSAVSRRVAHPGGGQPVTDTVALFVDGNIQDGSRLSFSTEVGGSNIVRVSGDVRGDANFFFSNTDPFSLFSKTNGSLGPHTVDFVQTGNISGSETVGMEVFPVATVGITYRFSFTGQLTGQLKLIEVVPSSAAHPPVNTLDEEFHLADGSTGTLSASENNQPHSLGTETLNVFKNGRVTTRVTGTIDQAFGSTPSTNDPGEVTITATP